MKKKLVVVGGANGVGKTTFAYQYREEFGIDYLDADAIAEEIKGRKDGNVEIERRFTRSQKNFKQVYLPIFDTWQLFYNGLRRPIEVAVGEKGKMMILDEEFYKGTSKN